MSRRDRRVCFSPDIDDKSMSDLINDSVSTRENHGRKVTKVWSFRLSKDSKYYGSIEFLRGLKTKVTKSIFLAPKKRSSGKVISSTNLSRCRSVSDQIDSHRAEALEDCIEFLNYSASFKRTNSVSSNY